MIALLLKEYSRPPCAPQDLRGKLFFLGGGGELHGFLLRGKGVFFCSNVQLGGGG